MGENLDNQLSVIKKAKKLGVDTIEFTTLTPHNNSSDAEYALKVCTEFFKDWLEIINRFLSPI